MTCPSSGGWLIWADSLRHLLQVTPEVSKDIESLFELPSRFDVVSTEEHRAVFRVGDLPLVGTATDCRLERETPDPELMAVAALVEDLDEESAPSEER